MADNADNFKVSVTIRHVGSGPDDARLIPAAIFERFFLAFHNAAKAARASLQVRTPQREFFISDLGMGSNVFAFSEASPPEDACLALLGRSVAAVYDSDFAVASENRALAFAIVRMGRARHRAFDAVIDFNGRKQIHVDERLERHAKSLELLLATELSKAEFFAGRAVDSFVGTLSELNSFHETWTAWLKLEGGKKIECVLDKSKGEKAYSECWTKRVSVTGIATYSGKSPLPGSLKVIRIEPLEKPSSLVDIRGSLSGYDLTDWDDLKLADFN